MIVPLLAWAQVRDSVFSRESKDIGIVQVQNSNLVILVGASNRFPPNKLSVFDISKSLNMMEIEFKSKIINVHWIKEWLIVVLQESVYTYTINHTPKRQHILETCVNSDGISDLCVGQVNILAIPGRNVGQVQIVKLLESKNALISLFVTHSSAISCLKLSESGKLLATASEKGTLIRVWSVSSFDLLNELRRGTDQARIYSITFSSDESRLAVSSDKGTIHIFNLTSSSGDSSIASGNRISIFSSISSILPKYFSSEWSWASFSLPVECPCIVSFASIESHSIGHVSKSNDFVSVLCSDGSYYKYRLSYLKKTFILDTFYVFWRSSISASSWKASNGFWDDWSEEGLI